MANLGYELAVRLGAAAFHVSQSRRHLPESADRKLSDERGRPLVDIHLPAGRPVYWFHAVSMGEVGVAGVLVRELKAQAPDALAVVSTATVTGYEAATTRIPGVDAVVAARFDLRGLVSSEFEFIHPAAVILVEGDLWRNMIAIAKRRGVPVFVANAKLSEKSLSFYRRFPLYSNSLFSRLDHVYAQTDLYRDRLEAAGLPDGRCEVVGNVKLDSTAPVVSADELAQLADAMGAQGASPIIVFGSIHPGEEIAAVRAMQRVWERQPGAYGILVPRHIEKAPQLAENIRREFGLGCRIYSHADRAAEGGRLSLVDKMGMLMKLYALADIAVVGGTLVAGVGGHNLTEPAFYGKPVVYGPHVGKQLGLHDLVRAYDAGRQSTEESFPDDVAALASDPELAARLGANGRRMVDDSRGVAARIVADILKRTAANVP